MGMTNISDKLHHTLREYCVHNGYTIRAVLEDAVERYLKSKGVTVE